MIECLNCLKKFNPSKNDNRIKFCCNSCRTEYRRKTNYMKKYYLDNKNKWVDTQQDKSYKDKKNTTRRMRYATDHEYREKIKSSVKAYNNNNPYKKTEQHLKEYGLTLDEYNNMLKRQNYVCEICGGVNDKKKYTKRPLFVDHNHKTGNVRGLLCDRCNFLIGNAREDINILLNSIEYLRKYESED